MTPRLLIFAGFSAVGKSTLADNLNAKYGFIRVDKDDPTFPTNDIINRELKAHDVSLGEWWDTPRAKQQLEPQLYQEVFARAATYLEDDKSVIIDGPLIAEAKQRDYLKNATKGINAPVDFFWFTSSPDKIRNSMYARNAERDFGKLHSPEAWQRYISGLDFAFKPAFEHRIVDTTNYNEAELVQHFEQMLKLG